MQKKLIIAVTLDNPYTDLEYLCNLCILNVTEICKVNFLIIGNPDFFTENLNPEIQYLQVSPKTGTGKIHKIAFTYAREKGYDLISVLPSSNLKMLSEVLHKLIKPFVTESLSFVLARQSIAKIGLTPLVQQVLFKKYVKDFYSKLIIYSTDSISKIPYHYNSDSEIFEAEIRVQLFFSLAKFKEIRLPLTKKLNNSVKIRTLLLLFQAYIHSLGLLYQRKFDIQSDNEQYDLKLGYASSHTYVLNAIKEGSKVIDIGAGPYGLAKWLIKKNCSVVTVDMFDMPDAYKLHKHIIADINKDTVTIKEYDYILFLDIIEHLQNPEAFLLNLSEQYNDRKQKIVFTTGNIAFLPIRIMLLAGFFNYGKRGILDTTHTRLFTFHSFKRLIIDSNLTITKIRGIPAPYPKAIKNKIIASSLLYLNLFFISISKNVFSYQIYVEAETKPSVKYYLEKIKSN